MYILIEYTYILHLSPHSSCYLTLCNIIVALKGNSHYSYHGSHSMTKLYKGLFLTESLSI
jgi:hypothetical protein